MPDIRRRALERNLSRFYLYCFFSNLMLWLPTWVTYLQRERGLTLGQITALDAPFWLIVVVSQVPTGAFADRYGRRTSLVVGAAVYSVALLVFGLASSYPIILVSYVFWAIALSFGSGADMALLYDNLAALGRSEEYPRAAGRAFGTTAAAAIVSLLLGAELARRTRLDVPVLVSAFTVLGAGCVAWTLHEPPRGHSDRPTFFQAVRTGAAISWRDPRLRYILGFAAVVRASSFIPIIFEQPFLQRYNVPLGAFGVLQAPGRLLGVVAALTAYRLQRRLGERGTFLGLIFWIGVCLLVLSLVDLPGTFAAFPCLAFALSSSNPVFSNYLNRHIPAAHRATVLSLGQLLGSLLLIGFEPLLGGVAQAAGLRPAFQVGLLCVAAGTIVTLGPWLRLKVRQGTGA